MKRFIRKKTYFVKTFELGLIVLALGVSLLFFNSNYDRIRNFKIYYSGAYFKAAKDKSTLTIMNQEEAHAKSVPVLVYHGIVATNDGSNVTLDEFNDQMLAMQAAGYSTISLEQFRKFMNGESGIPEKSFLLTFDDGRKDSYYPTDPILKALGYNAVVFVITDHLQSHDGYYLNEDELREMKSTGRWEIEPHTKSGHDLYQISSSEEKGHFFSNRLWLADENRFESDGEFEKRISDDFQEAKKAIEQITDERSTAFAFPFGDYGQDSINYLEAEEVVLSKVKDIYPISFYQSSGLNYPSPDAFLAKRISVKPQWSGKDLVDYLASNSEKEIPYEIDLTDNAESFIINGNTEIVGDALRLLPDENQTASSLILDKARSWTDYAFNTLLDWGNGNTITLIARYQDDNNYLACTVLEHWYTLESRVNGNRETLKEGPIDFEVPKESLPFGIKVSGNAVACALDNKMLAENEFNTALDKGSVGIRTWDPEVENSQIIVKNGRISNDPVTWEKIVESPTTSEMQSKPQVAEINLPYTLASNDLQSNWRTTWGEAGSSADKLIIKSSKDTTGAMTYLKGSENWVNYSLNAKVKWIKGSNIVIVVRFKDGENYSAFNIGEDYLRLEKYENGKRKIAQEVVNDGRIKKGVISLKMNVEDSRVSCFMNGRMLIFDNNIDEHLNSGGIGFKVWDKEKGNSQAIIEQMQVSAR